MKTILLTLMFAISRQVVFSQSSQLFIDIPLPKKSEKAYGYYDKLHKEVILNQQVGTEISRICYDNDFKLKTKYNFQTDRILNNGSQKKLCFVDKIILRSGLFELYTNYNSFQIIKLDFVKGEDKIIVTKNIPIDNGDYDLISCYAVDEKIAVLYYSKKNNWLTEYLVNGENGSVGEATYDLPASLLSADESKAWGSFLNIKYSKLLGFVKAQDLNDKSSYEIFYGKQLFVGKNQVFLIFPFDYDVGFHVIQIDRLEKRLKSHNYLINEVKSGERGTFYQRKLSLTAIDSTIVIQNCNVFEMQYMFYDIWSGKLLKELHAPVSKLDSLVHSGFIQGGTFGSKEETKELVNEKAFLRKKQKGQSFLLPSIENDSLTITFGAFIPTEGLSGALVQAITPAFAVGSFGNTDVLLLPQIVDPRNKIVFGHSRFHMRSFSPSQSMNIITPLNPLFIDNKFDALLTKSSFAFEIGDNLVLGVYNKTTGSYDIIRY